MGWLIFVGNLAAWLYIGFWLIGPLWAEREMQKYILRHHKNDTDSESRRRDIDRHREFTAGMLWGPALVWPLYLASYPIKKAILRRMESQSS